MTAYFAGAQGRRFLNSVRKNMFCDGINEGTISNALSFWLISPMPTRCANILVQTNIFGPLLVLAPADQQADIQAHADKVASDLMRTKAAGTLRTYRSAWIQYSEWCVQRDVAPLGADHPHQVESYAAELSARLATSTIRVHLAAIATAHRLIGQSFRLKNFYAPVGATPVPAAKKSAAALPKDVWQMLQAQPEGALGTRNRAMLLIGYGAALRRSELVALNVDDVNELPGVGLKVRVRSRRSAQGENLIVSFSKNDAFCPVHAWRSWMALRRSTEEGQALFCAVLKSGRLTGRRLSGKAVERLVRSASTSRCDANKRFTPHSLRAGLALAAIRGRAHLPDVARHTRHRYIELHPHAQFCRNSRTNVTKRVFNGLARPDFAASCP